MFRARGDAAADAGNLPEAVENWRKASELRPNESYLACNIGRAELRRTNHVEAATWLTRCLRRSPKPSTPDALARHKDLSVELETARQTVSALSIDVLEVGAEIAVDNEPAGEAPLPEDVFVLPGNHRIEVRNGSRFTATTLTTRPGKEYRVALALPVVPPAALRAEPGPTSGHAPAPSPATPERFRWWPIVVAGSVAGVGAAVGTAFTITSNTNSVNAASVLADLVDEGLSCGGSPIENDRRCITFHNYDVLRTNYSNAAQVSFVTAGVLTLGIVAYAIYENHRVTVTPTVGGITGRYQW